MIQIEVLDIYGCSHSLPDAPVHGCPYQEDVNDDYDYKCRCCISCQGECADDI